MSIAAALAADKEQAFHAPAAGSMAHRQTVDQVTIGAETYVTGDKVRAAFGRLVPYDYGVLPVMVVIQNDSRETIRLDQMNAEYVGPHGNRVTATPWPIGIWAMETLLQSLTGYKKPRASPGNGMPVR